MNDNNINNNQNVQPENPVVSSEVTPVVNPSTSVNPEPVITNSIPTVSPNVSSSPIVSTPKKKKPIALIIIIVVIVLLLLFAVGGVILVKVVLPHFGSSIEDIVEPSKIAVKDMYAHNPYDGVEVNESDYIVLTKEYQLYIYADDFAITVPKEGEISSYKYDPDNKMFFIIFKDDSGVYTLHVYDTKKDLFQYTYNGSPRVFSVAILSFEDDIIYLTDSDVLYAIDIKTGNEIWNSSINNSLYLKYKKYAFVDTTLINKKTGEKIENVNDVVDGYYSIISDDGIATVYDFNQKKLYTVDTSYEDSYLKRKLSGAAISLPNGYLYARYEKTSEIFDNSGKSVWKLDTDFSDLDIDGDLVLFDRIIFNTKTNHHFDCKPIVKTFDISKSYALVSDVKDFRKHYLYNFDTEKKIDADDNSRELKTTSDSSYVYVGSYYKTNFIYDSDLKVVDEADELGIINDDYYYKVDDEKVYLVNFKTKDKHEIEYNGKIYSFKNFGIILHDEDDKYSIYSIDQMIHKKNMES